MQFVVILLFICFIMFRNVKLNFLNPIFIYIVIWGSLIFFYQLNIFKAFPQLSLSFLLLIILTIFLFTIGASLGGKIKVERKRYTYNLKKMFRINTVLFLVVLVSFFITMAVLGPPPTLRGEISRADYYLGFVEIFYLLIYVFWFISFYLINQDYRKKSNYFLLFISLIIVFLKGNKFPVIYFLILIVYYMCLKKSYKLKYLLIMLGLVIITFYIAMYMYIDEGNNIMYYKMLSTSATLDEKWWFIADPLLYFTNNVMNLSNYMEVSTEHLFGLKALSGVTHLLRLEGLFENTIVNFDLSWKMNLQYSWLTTGTYLKDVYIDFGYIGMILVPPIYGYISGYYSNFIKNEKMKTSIIRLFIYYLLFISIVLSFFTSYLSSNEVLVNLIVVFIVHKYCFEKIANIEDS